MRTESFTTKLSPQEYDALVRAAKARAQVLRHEAGLAFWHAVARGLRTAVRGTRPNRAYSMEA
jgi:hypothetical protein